MHSWTNKASLHLVRLSKGWIWSISCMQAMEKEHLLGRVLIKVSFRQKETNTSKVSTLSFPSYHQEKFLSNRIGWEVQVIRYIYSRLKKSSHSCKVNKTPRMKQVFFSGRDRFILDWIKLPIISCIERRSVSNAARIYNAGSSVLQMGHSILTSIHCTRQSLWNRWSHGPSM